jgi:hypothetical protein
VSTVPQQADDFGADQPGPPDTTIFIFCLPLRLVCCVMLPIKLSNATRRGLPPCRLTFAKGIDSRQNAGACFRQRARSLPTYGVS